MAGTGFDLEAPAPEGPIDAVDSSAVDEIDPAAGDNKRKLDDLDPRGEEDEAPLKKQGVSTDSVPSAPADELGLGGNVEEAPRPDGDADGSPIDETPVAAIDDTKAGDAKDTEARENDAGARDSTGVVVGTHNNAEKPQEDEVNGSVIEGDQEFHKRDLLSIGNGQLSSAEDIQATSLAPGESGSTSRRIVVPNSKVGVLIGKSGDTIKSLQNNSGAKIQITRDAETDPHSSTRSVELIGTPECIDKAEKLIRDVIAEADAGGSPSLVARGFGTLQSGGDQTEIKIPIEKVGLIIGKGGETIKNLQTRSGARIQLIPQHLPEGDSSKERTIRITGNKKQLEIAKEMIRDAMNQVPMRSSSLSGGYNQQNFRPRGPSTISQWGSRPPTQPAMGYDYQQRGAYPPPQSTQYRQPYGGYQQQLPPRGGFGTGWDNRPAPGQGIPSVGGYDYYGQGSQPTGAPSNPTSAMHPGSMNYNYGQSQAPNYGHPAPAQPNYGQGYTDTKYDNQAPNQQYYGQQPMGMQSGVYGQQAQYGQPQSYQKPAYGVSQQDTTGYGPPRATQPSDPMYQGSAQSYAAHTPSQPYPYASNAPQQQAPAYNQTYGPTSGATDVYAQPPASYAQQAGPMIPPAYGQGAQPMTAYNQPSAQPAAYGQYPASQQSYGDPSAGSANYGYAGYGNTAQTTGYSAPQAGGTHPGYVQPAPNPSGYYDQSAPPQAGYGSNPAAAAAAAAAAPTAYAKSVSPQPAGYGGQYDGAQVYGQQ